jgi:CMP-N-acetylneuraminic acid synthetase
LVDLNSKIAMFTKWKNKESVLAVIPARGGSKGIRKKNIIPLNGKPLLLYTIEAAINSMRFKKICLSTDSSEIASHAENYNVDIIHRPFELSRDESETIDVVLDVIKHYESIGEIYDVVVLLQPTSPFRTAAHIMEAMDRFFSDPEISCVASFCQSKHHPYKQFYFGFDCKIKSLFGDEFVSMPRQFLPMIIRQNGSIYINVKVNLIQFKAFLVDPITPYIMTEFDSLDIDDEYDLFLADFYINLKNHKST